MNFHKVMTNNFNQPHNSFHVYIATGRDKVKKLLHPFSFKITKMGFLNSHNQKMRFYHDGKHHCSWTKKKKVSKNF